MIGVISKPGQEKVVEEFFELFKTPWEMYRPGRAYDVVVATGDVLAGVNGKLLLVYGAAAKDVDARIGVCGSGLHQSALLRHRGILFPIYGELLTFANRGERVCCVTANSEAAGVEGCQAECKVVRLGYDLFDEVRFLLSTGQPIEHAEVPTLEIHIGMLREWILSAGIPFLEIPPAPAGYKCAVCLTHDIDFVGIRNHRFDHTMWGFVYRATVGAVRNVARGRLSWAHMLESWRAVASLPLVYAGWKKDFWEPFGWYLRVERGLPATYFLIPFKRRAGQKVPGRNGGRRATAYDVGDLSQWRRILMEEGCEIGVHGIDAWHSAERGREELSKVAAGTENARTGIRMHWLLRDAETPTVLERAGYAYDSTIGYNETVGYRAGTGQVFRPLGAHALLELPLHIQDGALFYRQRLDLSEPEAETRCQALIEDVCEFGGVLTVLWHDRSHAPERFWGTFYVRLIGKLQSISAWFGTAGQVVIWFRKRRGVRFERVDGPGGPRVRLCYEGDEIQPPLKVRVYGPQGRPHVDIPWNGEVSGGLDLDIASWPGNLSPDAALSSGS